ncbi:hypothetical protein BG015_004145 [Linnemannia schmuckeri]|uniref:Uncharacterized protein n=1 Tax=Linnemannia schmuckeri TaxID=64567 RepID=A0A9P5RG43_9FUNG|nr:hypothetical protein BG015_004145 [Linnemannia schmuckeri]
MPSSTPTLPSLLPDTTILPLPLPQQVTSPTASLSSLPPECLEHILAYHRSDLTLLHALLLVNRTFFQLTVPLLYQSPFLLIKASDRDRLPYEKFKRQVKLLWLLLSSVHHLPWVRQELPPFADEFPVLWNPALEEGQVLALLGGGRSSSISSSAMSQESDSIGPDGTRRLDGKRKGGVSVRFLTVDYLNYYTHHNHSSISDALPTLFPSLICYHMDQWSSSQDMIRIRATVERALLMHRPEGIVSLAVPITRVKAVQEAVAAAVAEKESSGAAVSGVGLGLRRLRRVEFYDIRQEFSVEDVLAFLDTLRRPPSSPSSSTGTGIGTGTGTGAMLLTEIKIGGPSDYGQIGKRSLYTILQHLSPTLKVIDLTDWRGAVMDLDQIPTEAVEVLHLRLDRMVVDSTGPKVVEGWLKRAKKLRDLQICIGPGHGGLFRWAVERRRRRERNALLLQARREGELSNGQQRELMCRIDREERSPSSGEDDTDGSTGDDDDDGDNDDDDEETYLTTRGGSPTGMSWVDQSNNKSNTYEDEGGLRKLSLAGETPAVLWGLLGATTAFCDRLEMLAASSWKQPPCVPTETSPVAGHGSTHGGQGHGHGHTSAPRPATPRLYWSAMMTRLVHLDLKGEIASVSFDMQSLTQAPYLQRLKLDTYKSDIEPALTRVPELLDSVSGTVCELELVGPWFVTDWDLERMGSVLPRLRRLKLSHCKTRLKDREVVEGEEGDEEGEGEAEVSAVSRLPDYLLAAMPMQQDITSPSTPVSSRTRSHTSGQQKQKQESASTSSSRTRSSTTLLPSSNSSPATVTPSSRHLSTRGLVHAVEQMTDLHYLHIGILISSKPPPLFETNSSSSSFSSGGAGMSPWDMLAAASAGESRRATEKGKVDEGESGDEESLLCLDEKSLLKAFGAQKGSESRAFPLEVEVQECRAF